MNRWLGGVATTYSMVERVVAATGTKAPISVGGRRRIWGSSQDHGERLARRGVVLDFTLLDRAPRICLPGREL